MDFKPDILRFAFGGFEHLAHAPGDKIEAEDWARDRHGNEWGLSINPGGWDDSDGEVGKKNVSLSIHNHSSADVEAKVTVYVKNMHGRVHDPESNPLSIIVCFLSGTWAIIGDLRLKRSDILNKDNNILLNENLVVDVELQIMSDGKHKIQPKFQPVNPAVKNMRKLFESKEGADVAFKVGGDVIPAHKLILQMNAPVLYNFCRNHDMASPVELKDVSPDIFHHILDYVYGGDASEAKDLADEYITVTCSNVVRLLQRGEVQVAKAVINAADRYGVVGLKMEMEKALVELRILDIRNFAEWLLFADAKTCPLLKEYCMSFYSARVKDIIADDSFKKIEQSTRLMKELMLSTFEDPNERSRLTIATVDELRRHLDTKGLDVDGSKEMLESRLNEANKRQRTGA